MLLTSGTLAAFGLVLTRTGAMVLSAPILGLGSRFQGYKIALVFTLSLLFYLTFCEPLQGGTEPIGYGMLALREVLIGLFLAFLFTLVLQAVRVGGEMIGQEMGFLVARQVDPATGIQTPLITAVYENLFLLSILLLNGHHWIIRSLGHSFERAPIGKLSLSGGIADAVTTMFGEMFQAGIVFAAPVLVFLMLTSILIGLLARAVPHMNVLEIGFTMRVLIALVAMFVFAPLLEPAMLKLHDQLAKWMDIGLDVLEV